MYLIDTNIFIRAFKGYEDESRFLENKIKKEVIVISAVVVGEFFTKAGVEERELFESLLRKFKTLVLTEKDARVAAQYRNEFFRKTKRVFMLDCFLAAQAKLNNLTLVTNNKTDFPMKDIKIITP